MKTSCPTRATYAMLRGNIVEGGSMATKVREVAYVGLEAVLAYCCGLDVHKKRITACLLVGPVDQPPKELLSTFTTTTKGLTALRDWLASYDCTHVAMESTGIFWRPVFNILEGSVTILLANARHMKQLPGRKTDINDSQWIARLLRWGITQAQFDSSQTHPGTARNVPLSQEAYSGGWCRKEPGTQDLGGCQY
jgi:hypothetical protein